MYRVAGYLNEIANHGKIFVDGQFVNVCLESAVVVLCPSRAQAVLNILSCLV